MSKPTISPIDIPLNPLMSFVFPTAYFTALSKQKQNLPPNINVNVYKELDELPKKSLVTYSTLYKQAAYSPLLYFQVCKATTVFSLFALIMKPKVTTWLKWARRICQTRIYLYHNTKNRSKWNKKPYCILPKEFFKR
jgi:hypothetical protein